MSSKSRDIRLQGLILGGVAIPLGGEGISVRIDPGTIGEVVRGNATSIKTMPGERPGTLAVSVYGEDAAAPILRGIAEARRIPGATALPWPGSYINGSNGEAATWQDAHLTVAPPIVGGSGTEIGTYTFELIGLVITQAAA